MQIPQSKKEDITEEVAGIPVADPYRWLEDANSEDVKTWIHEENSYTESFLKNKRQEIFRDELAKNFRTVSFSNPVYINGNYFYTERKLDEDQPVLYVKKGLNGEALIIINPNGKKEGNTVSLDYWFPNRTGDHVVYGLSEGGVEMATLYIYDVNAQKLLPDKILNCRHSSVRWMPDGSAFFYTRNPKPGSVPKNEEHLHQKVYFHQLGKDPESDELIFGEGRPKDDMIGLSISIDGKYLAIDVRQSWTENDVYIYDITQKKMTPIITGVPSNFTIYFLNNGAIIHTDYKASNHRVLWTPFAKIYQPLDEWEEFVAERPYPSSSLAITKDKIFLEYLVNACSKIVILDHAGNEKGEIPLPQYSTVSGISTRSTESEFFYGVESFTFPKITYRYDPASGSYDVYRKTENPIDPEKYLVKQEWFTSKDGTKVPMFIFHKKEIIYGSAPTILSGYGGFGSNEMPVFMKGWLLWLERGGIFAIANIRGGGEFGKAWHKDGIKEKKQNSFDDFIAAAEYLIGKNYTDSGHIGIVGGSNGGLLVSAVAIQRPELFKAVCARVPLTDMVRFPKFGIAIRWTHEYGDPNMRADLERILAWSPYHNVKGGVEYPNILFTTAEKDTRVNPLHARKMTAMLQAINKENKVFIFTESEAGHGSGKPITKLVELQSMTLEFFMEELGLGNNEI